MSSNFDRERALQLLFEPGFSTRDSADEMAGRGVGLDVVKRQVESMGGSIQVMSELHRGTSFQLSVPAALTQEKLLVVRVNATLYGLPSLWVLAVTRQSGTAQDSGLYEYGPQTIPLRPLSGLLDGEISEGEPYILVLRLSDKLFALRCPEVLGQFELIRRPTSVSLKQRNGVCASAQLDDGRLVLVLDQEFLVGRLSDQQRGTFPVSRGPRKQEVRRVLVVDDSVVVRNLIGETLLAAGYEVAFAENGALGLSVLQTFNPSLVISDIEMPKMDGFEFLRAIRARSETLPVIMVTARSSTEDRHRASSLGANAYVAKGEFRSESLVSIVQRYFPGGT